jgi:hypothetical protein
MSSSATGLQNKSIRRDSSLDATDETTPPTSHSSQPISLNKNDRSNLRRFLPLLLLYHLHQSSPHPSGDPSQASISPCQVEACNSTPQQQQHHLSSPSPHQPTSQVHAPSPPNPTTAITQTPTTIALHRESPSKPASLCSAA